MIYLYTSPMGNIFYDWDGLHCCRVYLQAQDQFVVAHDDPVAEWLECYCRGKVAPLPPLALAGTGFQQSMREALLNIPAGKVRTYGEIAKDLHSSPRAMGQALKANPLPILIPCHRIVAAHGLGGFAGGKGWKMRLLSFESALCAPKAS